MTNFEYIIENDKELVLECLANNIGLFQNQHHMCSDIDECVHCNFNQTGSTCYQSTKDWLNKERE